MRLLVGEVRLDYAARSHSADVPECTRDGHANEMSTTLSVAARQRLQE